MGSSGLKTLYRAGYIKSADYENLKDLDIGECYQNLFIRNGQVSSAVRGLFGLEIHILHYDDQHFETMVSDCSEFNLNYRGYGAEQSHSCLVVNDDAVYISYKKKFICFPEWPDYEDTYPQFRLFYFGRNLDWLAPIFPELDEQVCAIYVDIDIQIELLGEQVHLIKNKLYYRKYLKEMPTVDVTDEAGWYSFPEQIRKLVLETSHWYNYYLQNKGLAQFEALAPQALKFTFVPFLESNFSKKCLSKQLIRWDKRLVFELLLFTHGQPSDFKRMYHFIVAKSKDGQLFVEFIEVVYSFFESSFGHSVREETKRQLNEYLMAGYAKLETSFKTEKALSRHLMSHFMVNRDVSRDHFIPDFTIDHRYDVLKSTARYSFEFIDNSARLAKESQVMGNCAKIYWKEMFYQEKVFYHITNKEIISVNTIYTLCLYAKPAMLIYKLESPLNGKAPQDLYDEIERQLANWKKRN